jgi:hypothetical protein
MAENNQQLNRFPIILDRDRRPIDIATISGRDVALTSDQSEFLSELLQESLGRFQRQAPTQNLSKSSSQNRPAEATYARLRSSQQEVRSLVEQLGYFSAIFEAETAFIAQNIRVRMVITNCATATCLLALGPATLSAAMF